MTRDGKHYPDDKPVPLSAWWLLGGTGKPPTWHQLERGATARRREPPMSHAKPEGVKTKQGNGLEKGDVDGHHAEDALGGAEQAAKTAERKQNKAGKMAGPGFPGIRTCGSGFLPRLMNRFRKRPLKRPLKRPFSSDIQQQDDAALEAGDGM